MKLFIPSLGTRLILTKEWRARVPYEHRNSALMKRLGILHTGYMRNNLHWSTTVVNDTGEAIQCKPHVDDISIVLPQFTVLMMDRIYIRKNLEDYDSITFEIDNIPVAGLAPQPRRGFLTGRARFWVPLEYANTIECEIG